MLKIKLLVLTCFISLSLYGQEIERLNDTNFKLTISGKTSVDQLKNISLFQQSEVELTRIKYKEDKQGNSHIRYQALVQGVPVKGMQITGHYSLRSQETIFIIPRGLPQKYNTALSLSARKITYDEALGIVKKTVEGKHYKKLEASPTGTAEGLVIVPQRYDFKKPIWVLAYEIDVQTEGPWQSKRVTVDAQSGEVIFVENRLCSFHVPGMTETHYHGTREIETTEQNGIYIMHDQTRGTGIYTTDYNTGQIFTDDDNYWDMDPAAGDVHWGSEATFDFYMDELGLNGLDDNGRGIVSRVHMDIANAFWDGEATIYGDGDPFGLYNMPITYINIVGHEITHGVTEFSSGLIYSGESGALNESISDIMGVCVEHYTNPGIVDWLIGEDVSSTGSYFRNMANPNDVSMANTYLGQYWDPFEAVHSNSSIGNYWFYLLVTGGSGTNDNNYTYSIDSLGWEKARLIAHNTWVNYLTPSSDYSTCAELSIIETTILYGACSFELAQVRNAWAAVGVLSSGSEAAIRANPRKICTIPTPVDFFATGEVANHLWDFGDGNQSNDPNPSHTYQDIGTYTVSLSGTDCNNDTISVIEQDFIIVDTLSNSCDTIYMDMNQTVSSCEGMLVDDQSNNYVNLYTIVEIEAPDAKAYQIDIQKFNTDYFFDYLRLFVDTGSGYELVQTFYGNLPPSTFIVEGTKIQFIWDTSGFSSSDFVIAWQCLTPSIPIADFSARNTISCDAYVALEDESTGFPDSWVWMLEGDSVASDENPVISLPDIGTYDIGLIACNDLGCDTLTIPDYVTYDDQRSFCDTIIMADDLNMISYACQGILTDDGGIDGDYSNSVYSIVEIEAPGALAYQLDIQSFDGGDCCHYLRVYADNGNGNGYELVESFSGNLQPSTFTIEGSKIRFLWRVNESSAYPGFVISWQCLTLTVPIADFSTQNTIFCNGYVILEDESIGFPDSWLWLLEGDSVASVKDPFISLPDTGTYDIGLIACNDLGCDTLIIPDYVTYDELTLCDTIIMADDLIMTSYACEGILTDDGGVDGNYDNNVQAIVEIEAPGALAYQIDIQSFYGASCCDYLRVYTDNGNGYELVETLYEDIQSGAFIVEGTKIQFTWNTNGYSTAPGFVFAWQCLIPSIPIADFSTQNTISCSSYVTLEDESMGFPDSWLWLLEGDSVASDENPLIRLPAVGTYDISLIACNDLGCDTLTIPDYVTYDDQRSFCDTIIMKDNLNMISYACEGVLADDGGIDGDYDNNVYAVVEIEAPDAKAYQIDIQQFRTDNFRDSLYVYADNGNGYELAEAFHGNVQQDTFIVEGTKIQFIWETNEFSTYSGFVIAWQCLAPSVPIADFSAQNTIACDAYVALEDESIGYPDSWLWLLEGDSVASVQNPLISLPDIGTYDIGLITCNDLGCDTLTIPDYVTYDDQFSFCDTIIMADELNMISYACEGILIDDGGIDGNYGYSVYSIVEIEAPGALAYQFDIQSFYGESCCDYLLMYADNGTGYEFVRGFLGNIQPSTFITEGTKIRVLWDTDGALTYPGFVLAWQCIGSDDEPQAALTYQIKPCTYTVTLNSNAFNADTVIWDLGDGNTTNGLSVTHTYEEADTYTVYMEATNANGTSIDSLIVETPFIKTAMFDAPDQILLNTPQGITLSSHDIGEISSIQWFLDNVLISDSYYLILELTEPEIHALSCVITDNNNCTSSHSEAINVIVAVDEPEAFDKVAIFPNPTSGKLHINNLSVLNGVSGISLLSAVGQLVVTASPAFNTDQISLNLHSLPTGIYLLKIQTTHGKAYFKKVVKTD